MPRSAYPHNGDLLAAFIDAGLGDVAPSDLWPAVRAAISGLERDTGYRPFLALSTETPRKFTPDGPRQNGRRSGGSTRLFLEAGLLSCSMLMVDGDELVEGEDYWLEPASAPADGQPYTWIRFARPLWATQQGVTILGVWGFCEALPDDVWFGLIKSAACKLRGEITRRFADSKIASQNAVIKAKESGPLRVEFAAASGEKIIDLSATFTAWENEYLACLTNRTLPAF